MEKNINYFNKIQSDYIFTYLLTFFNLSDIRSIFPLSKRFATILNKDNKKIIRDIQKKIFSKQISDKLILSTNKIKISNFSFNKSPIINSIILEHFLISSSYQFDSGFLVYDLRKNKLIKKILFEGKNYSYVNSMLFIKEKKILLIGTNNEYIIGFYLNKENNLKEFLEYKTGFNKEIKNMVYYKLNNQFIIISLDSNDSIYLNFLRVFYIKNNENKFHENQNDIIYIKTFIIKNILIYNIQYFEDNNTQFICLASNKENNCVNENNINNVFKKDKIMNNYLGILYINKIKLYLNDINLIKNYEYLIKNNTYEELYIDNYFKEHKSYITDYLYLKENKIILSVEYLSPYLFIWDINTKLKIKSILLPQTDSILC